MRDQIETYWGELGTAMQHMPFALVARAAEMLLACYRRGGMVFVLGNGGSAATASHFACDLAKGTKSEFTPAFRVMPLTDNVPLITAWANDTGYQRVFAEQLAALVRSGDVLVAISASGNSPNVLTAAEVARDSGATCIALTGATGGRLDALADLTIKFPSSRIEQVEDAHLMIAHSICVALRHHLHRREALLETSMNGLATDVVVADGVGGSD
jgi:D-sedoheptulose 7-phosphate isomerase